MAIFSFRCRTIDSALDYIQPLLADFLEWLEDLCQNRQIQNERNLIATCRTIQAILSGFSASR